MNTSQVAAALNTLSMGLAELAEALNDSGPVRPVAGQGSVSPASSAPTFSDGLPVEEPPLFPDQFEDPRPQPSLVDESVEFRPPRPTEQDIVLGRCPTHDVPWTIKPGGISKNGKPYSAFWKCAEKNDDGSWCSKKPDKTWTRTHDPEKALAAA